MNKTITNNDKGMDAILQGVELLIGSKINKQSPFDRTLSGIVTKADYETNTYCVKINGYEYRDIMSTLKVNVNDSVMVMCPQNQLSQMFIYDKIDTTNYLDATIYKQNTIINVTENIKGILTNDITLTLKLQEGSIYMLCGVSYTLSTGAVGNYSTHLIYPSLISTDSLNTPIKLNGTTNNPFTIATQPNQSLNLTNLGSGYNAHFALYKIY
jgi:hypothetical protein